MKITNYFVLCTILSFFVSGCSGGDTEPSAPPVKPTNVKTLAGDAAITLSWDNIPGVSYTIYMASQTGVNKAGVTDDKSTKLSNFMVHSSVPNPFRHVNLNNGVTYYFNVVAVNAESQESVLSTEVFATPVGQLLPASNLVSTLTTSGQIALLWQDEGSLEIGYKIERAERLADNNYGAWNELSQVSQNQTQYIDYNITPATTYQYRVYAYTDSESTEFSNVITVFAPQNDTNKFLRFSNNVEPRYSDTEQKIINPSAPRYVENASTAQAYYKAIDPSNSKTTFTDWKRINGFETGTNPDADTPAIYFNDTDLGFGRRMYVNNQADGGVASYVQNYPTLADAINNTNLIVTVAMEYTQPENDQNIESKKQIVIGQGNAKIAISAVMTRDFLPGTYKVIAARGNADRLSKGTFKLTIKYDDGQSAAITHNGEWVSEWLDVNDYTDPTNPIYTFDVTTLPTDPTAARSVTIELSSDLDDQIILLESIGKVIAEDDNSGGGTSAKITLALDAGIYSVIPTSTNNYALASSGGITTTIASANRTYLTQSRKLPPVGINDPNSAGYISWNEFVVQAYDVLNGPVDVTITVTADAGAIVDPYIYLLGANGTGQDVFRRFTTTNEQVARGTSVVSLDLPAGTYSAVAGTFRIGNQGSFNLQVLDDKGVELPLENPSIPQLWASSGGATPYSTDNPNFRFTVRPAAGFATQRVNVRLNTDPTVTTLQPLLYVLGDSGQYRHIEAANTGTLKANPTRAEARIETSLPAGTYTVVAGTETPGYAGNYQLDISDQGTSLLSLPGSWISSSGTAVQGAGNPRTSFTLGQSSVVSIRLQSAADMQPVIYLLDSQAGVVHQNSIPDATKSIVDTQLLPGDYRLVMTTDSSSGKRADFSLDVSINGVANTPISGAWVSSVKNNPYSPSNPYFPLHLTKNSHVKATLVSSVPVQLFIIGQGEQNITTFYTFAADGTRVTQVDLDGRGAKPQPGVCLPCHGGAPKALLGGNYPDHGDTGSSFIAWDLDLFIYPATNSNYSRSALEPKLKEFNKMVLATRLVPSTGVKENEEPARNTVIKGWYGGADLPQETFNGNFVPALWIPDSKSGVNNNIADGADELYLNIVKPTCRVCHLQQGGVLFPLSYIPEPALAFASYAGFISYQQRIEETIYDKATMPMAYRTFNKFWQQGQAKILADLLPNFGRYSDPVAQAEILQPGRAIADAGTSPLLGNKVVAMNQAFTLNGKASIFADNFSWVMTAPTGSSSSSNAVWLSTLNTANPTFIPDTLGDYRFELTVSNPRGESTSIITVTADSLVNTSPVSFSNDIKPLFDVQLSNYITDPMGHCMKCHEKRENKYYLPFGEYLNQRTTINAKYMVDFGSGDIYATVRDRVNIDQPQHSLILEKPTNDLWHGGKGEGGFNLTGSVNKTRNYELLLRWILEGARNN